MNQKNRRKQIMKCKFCGNDQLVAHQVVRMDILVDGESDAIEIAKLQSWKNALLEGGMDQNQVEAITTTYDDAYVAYKCKDFLLQGGNIELFRTCVKSTDVCTANCILSAVSSGDISEATAASIAAAIRLAETWSEKEYAERESENPEDLENLIYWGDDFEKMADILIELASQDNMSGDVILSMVVQNLESNPYALLERSSYGLQA
jgi:hypothetical protein